uniref:Zn-dependent peptidase ImmA, M78 family n=1 Tax=Candidatus Kentrum eta TaxID=2126337 RepID=A0A450V935_9GAMM|nr:MAG: Zn-dependent peptidase ImmA, M78 family [Candidatus Kentron sp. H]VFK01227.1 MAG: Zn-dependent peptidase ImmA, M78 family [Candidatus Kentron sp. H]VFK04844.1 MAG: Zn-dependent peptidase ImmA, M78 family [Candidatus Kentron sp. H]
MTTQARRKTTSCAISISRLPSPLPAWPNGFAAIWISRFRSNSPGREKIKALGNWRDALEEHGVFVFKDSFNPAGKKKPGATDSPFSGFCLHDPEFPIIYLDNNKPKTRQIFTLFHELAHLLMRTGGVHTRQDDYIEHLTGDDKRIEVLCNRFAAEFLAPTEDFRTHSAGMTIDDHAIEDLAKRYWVSRKTILRRLLDGKRVSQEHYEQKVRQWRDEHRDRKAGGGGGDPYNQGNRMKLFSNCH